METSSGWAVRLRVAYLVTITAATLATAFLEPPVALGGATWTRQASGTAHNLLGVACVNANDAWAVGDQGTILSTADGGAHWTSPLPKDFSTSAALFGVSFSDASNGWVVGNSGWVFATTDGGAHWAQQTSPTNSTLRSVTFTDPSNGWAVGDDGAVIHTTDGGAHWAQQKSNTTASLDSVTFTDPSNGWAEGWDATGTPFSFICVIDHTSDGGAHWAVQRSTSHTAGPLAPPDGGVTFVNAQDGWAVDGVASAVIHTTDGGAHWSTQTGAGDDVDAITFANASDGWVLPQYGGQILGTTDGGAHWADESAADTGVLFGIASYDASHGWAVGENGLIMACGSAVTCTLSIPRASGTPTHKRSTTFAGSISPSHAATLSLKIERKHGSSYKAYLTRTVKASSKGKWSIKIKLPAGTYRLRTSCSAAGDYSAATSNWGHVVVK